MIKRSKNDKIGINSLITQILTIEIAQTNLGLIEHKCLRKLTKFQQNCYMGIVQYYNFLIVSEIMCWPKYELKNHSMVSVRVLQSMAHGLLSCHSCGTELNNRELY